MRVFHLCPKSCTIRSKKTYDLLLGSRIACCGTEHAIDRVHQWVLVIVPFASNSARDVHLCAYDALARAYRLVFGFPNGSSHRDGLSRIVSSLLYLVHSYRLYTSILDTHVCGLLNNAF